MQKLTMFNLVTMDGYFAGPKGDLSWHRVDDEEFQSLARRNANSGRTLIFGRVTYDLMESFWPTPEALREAPVVARGMNESPKVVFSRTMKSAKWSNTVLARGDLLEEIRRLKEQPGRGLMIMGSGNLVAQLAQARLIDEFEILVVPTAIGTGRSLFEGIRERLEFKLVASRAFKNGVTFSSYVPG